MKIIFDRVCSSGGLQDLSLELLVERVCVINDSTELQGKRILNTIIGLDEIISGSLTIDGIPWLEFISHQPMPRVFGYVFDEAVMLSNLSLRENLLLPYRMLNDDKADDNFETEVQDWMRQFGLSLDLASRPNVIRPPELKLLGFIRPLLFSPRLLLIDNPYYLLNEPQRCTVLEVLNRLKSSLPLLILSSDSDFNRGFAAQIIKI
ncbi:MAG TPA: hypothetical protein P5533_00445 [Candidatus Cloacimonadota bacterium]|nr:hypothetical protein [Candidatus Cloacimonadota bacterium]